MDGGRGDTTGTLLGDGLIMLAGIAVDGGDPVARHAVCGRHLGVTGSPLSASVQGGYPFT